ncbi:hypothetical protein [Parasedimentitalea psychrophila]
MVDEDQWDRVQEKLQKAAGRKRPSTTGLD